MVARIVVVQGETTLMTSVSKVKLVKLSVIQ